ncbi:MAG: gamma-glutamyl-gamma-aminobutyrate hydrolase family protein [Bacteroidales bacterium]|jgi:putative glutamine amidotransferase
MRKISITYFIFLFIFFISSFTLIANGLKNDTLFIAFSKASGNKNYINYVKWITHYDKSIVCVDMIKKKPEQACELLEKCSGLILTGGLDVDPARYGRTKDSSRCELDKRRDTLEFALIKKAMELRLPVLGICRGEQVLNVAMGGSLIIDIPKDHDTIVHHQTKEGTHTKHYVSLVQGTYLFNQCDTKGDTVASNHHQAVDKLADCFKVSAWANDSIVEAFEWKYPQGKSFLIAVQWHPEKPDTKNALSLPIGKSFIDEAKKYNINLKSKRMQLLLSK